MLVKVLIDNISKDNLISEWGLSIYIEYNGLKILLDTGSSGFFAENAASTGIHLDEIDFGVLSHAHYDHADGMAAFFEANKKAKFYVRSGTAENCYGLKEDGLKYIGIKKGYLNQYRDRIIYVNGDYEISPGVTLLPHKTPDLDTIGRKADLYIDVNGRICPDCFSHEQSLVIDGEKGCVIFSSCSHGGASNIIRETAVTWPEKRIYAMVGGFHLYQSSLEDIIKLANEIKATGIQKIYTGHCTGDEAFVILKNELGDMVEQIYTGMDITL